MAVIEQRTGKDGKPVYRAKVRIKGRPAESQTFERKTDAKLWAQERETELRKERVFGQKPAVDKPLAELIDRYIENEVPKRRSEKRWVITCLTWWRSEIGDKPLKEISPPVLAACRDKLLGSAHQSHKYTGKKAATKGKSPTTVVRYMAALSHAFSIAVSEWEWLETNPMSRVKRPSLPRSRVRFLSDDERKRLLKACKESPCEYLYTVVVLALSTGARYSEIMNLRWEDVDFERKAARLNKTKNNERRAIAITHHAHELLLDLRARTKPNPQAFIFARADGQAPMDIRKHWNAAVHSAGVEDFRFHDLRHTAASYLAMNGATLAEIAEILGHKTLQMVKRYAHLSDQHVTSVVEKMNKKIFVDANEEEV